MSRPACPRIFSKAMPDGIHTLEVLDLPEQWAVTYQGRMCGLMKLHLISSPKYPRTIFQTRAPAENLARKLNQQFNTEDFGVAVVKVEVTAEEQETAVSKTKTRRPRTGGQFQTNLSKSADAGELLTGGHIRYSKQDGTEIIRVNSRAYPTKNIQKYAVKKTEDT